MPALYRRGGESARRRDGGTGSAGARRRWPPVGSGGGAVAQQAHQLVFALLQELEARLLLGAAGPMGETGFRGFDQLLDLLFRQPGAEIAPEGLQGGEGIAV